MTEALPGSSSGKDWGSALAKAGLRLVGGPDLADVIADLTGLSAKRVRRLVDKGASRLAPNLAGAPNFFAYQAVEELVVKAFSRAAASPRPADRHAVPVAALMGPEELAAWVEPFAAPDDTFAVDEKAYYRALTLTVASMANEFYFSDDNARSYATAAAVGRLVRDNAEQAVQLARIEAGVNSVTQGAVTQNSTAPTAQTSPTTWIATGGPSTVTKIAVTTHPDHRDRPYVRRCTQWARWALENQGYDVVAGTQGGHPDELRVVVSGADLPDASGASTTAYTSQNPPIGSAIGLSFDEFGYLEHDSTRADAAGAANMLRTLIDPLVAGRWRARNQGIEYDAGTELPRLRRLSDGAMRDAAAVGSRSFATPSPAGSLYVERDLEHVVLEALTEKDLVVVSGEAGAGKTSLLWGLARHFVSQQQHTDVYFLKASYLFGTGTSEPAVTARALVDAIRGRSLLAESIVFVDTADLLVNDRRAFDGLMDLVAQVRAIHGRVVITSRPAEALTITAGSDTPLELRPFSTQASSHASGSEFVRAVRAHAFAYCSVPGDTGDISQQMLAAAVRGTPLGSMARLPLFLRMLFELYAPGTVPEHISATRLFERFWNDRVVEDRRTWATVPAADEDDRRSAERDLSSCCVALAAAMLRDGLPEARVGFGPVEFATATATEFDVELLCRRGVGSKNPDGTFAFFHQAFFEFAAARLMTNDNGGLTELLDRAEARPDDYFVAPVAEQAWILAFGRPDRAVEARTLAATHLRSERVDLLRRILRVLAQVIVPADLTAELLAVGATCDIDLAKEHLRLLPRPQTVWQHSDSALLAVVHSRPNDGHAPVHAVLDVLARLALTSSSSASSAVQRLVSSSSRAFLDDASIDQPETRLILKVLTRHDTNSALAILDTFGVGRVLASEHTQLARILNVLTAAPSDYAAFVAEWAVAVANKAPTALLVESLTDLIRSALDVTPPSDPVAATRDSIVQLLAESAPRAPAVAQTAALIEHAFRRAFHPPFDVLLDDLLDELLTFADPRFHEHLHHGWLVRPINDSPLARHKLADVLAFGLPASHRAPHGSAERWSDTIRRALARPEMGSHALADILELAVQALAQSHADTDRWWVDGDGLSWLLLPAVNVGIQSASDVVTRWRNGQLSVPDNVVRIVVQQAVTIAELGPGGELLVDFLIDNGAFVELRRLLPLVSGHIWTETRGQALLTRALKTIRTEQPQVAAQALRLLLDAVSRQIVPLPNWAALRSAIRVHARIVVPAAELMVAGVRAGAYPADEIAELLTKWLSKSSTESRDLRRQLVLLRSATGDAAGIDESVDLAFVGPDTGTIVALTGYLNRDPTIGPLIPSSAAVEMLVNIGERLTRPELTTRVRRDVPGAWGEVIARVLNRAGDDELMGMVEALPRMSVTFATRMLSGVPARNSPGLRERIAAIRDDPDTPATLSRQAAIKMAAASVYHANDWPELDQTLHSLQMASRHRG